MRLLDVFTYQLCNSNGREVPDYAILSHRWTLEEVSFLQLQQDPTFLTEKGRSLTGAVKIRHFCQKAAEAEIKYVWVDTCCIDKSSSAELSEAINSMFSWYREAKLCIVHLTDVEVSENDLQSMYQSFENSEWFKRGWTLPELIAPSKINFYDSSWRLIGTKESLQRPIERASGIYQSDFLYFEKHPDTESYGQRPSIGRRLSWAAQRKTTYPEDLAYCLLGLCRINMPLLYGEGAKRAFHRLQVAILQSQDDGTVLAWDRPSEPSIKRLGVLAQSTVDFLRAGDVSLSEASVRPDRPPFTITPRGLLTHSNLWYSTISGHQHKYLPMRCLNSSGHIFLRLTEAGDGYPKHLHFRDGPLFRANSDELLTENPIPEIVYLATNSAEPNDKSAKF